MSALYSSSIRTGGWLDRSGAAVGLLCAAHCLAFPLLVGLLPLLGHLGEEPIEHALITMALVIGAVAAVLAWRRHHDRALLALFVVGLTLLGLCTTLEGEDPWLLIPASALVTGAHVWSYRLGRRPCSDSR